MKISFNYLNKYIDLHDFSNKPNEISNLLCKAGIEVEAWEDISKKFQNLMVVEVKGIKKHPSADRLRLCNVYAGSEFESRSIVCGAFNFQEGDKTVLALPGTTLPGGLNIQTQKIRGELSHGMMLSFSELGFAPQNADNDGIIVLPKESPPGRDFADFAGLNDIIFEFSITPNRSDCLSHFGLARELSCLLNRPLLEGYFTKKPAGTGDFVKEKLGLEVKQPELCFRYTGRAIYNVQIQHSPLWLKLGLENLGLKSINNIVDVTNYLMIQTGQPLHAFDMDQLSDKVIVDFSKKGELFKTLDDNEIHLTGKELCIRDAQKTVALAGVIGGRKSGVHSGTKNIFLESACFSPQHVRAVSKQWQIDTDASYRFSRGVDPEMTENILHEASVLIQSLAGGNISKDYHDEYAHSIQRKNIFIKQKDLERRLGLPVDFKKFSTWMTKLNCKSELSKQKDSAKVTPPSYRFDLHVKEDLIEEFARLEGYDKIPEADSLIPSLPVSSKDVQSYHRENQISGILVSQGFFQSVNHSFISQKFSKCFIESFTDHSDDTKLQSSVRDSFFTYLEQNKKNWNPVFIKNPLSSEYDMMRISMAPSLFKNAVHNLKHGSRYGRLFELGYVFSKEEKYQEHPRLALLAWGQKEGLWSKSENRPCVYDLKTAVSGLLDHLLIADYEWEQVFNNIPSFMHPGQFMQLKVEGQVQGYIGSVHSSLLQKHKIRTNMAITELNIKNLLKREVKKKSFKKFSYFPQVERDISLLVPENFPAGKLVQSLKQIAGALCYDVKLFDSYKVKDQSKNAENRSITFRLYLQSQNKTLTEKDLKQLQHKIITELSAKWPVKLR